MSTNSARNISVGIRQVIAKSGVFVNAQNTASKKRKKQKQNDYLRKKQKKPPGLQLKKPQKKRRKTQNRKHKLKPSQESSPRPSPILHLKARLNLKPKPGGESLCQMLFRQNRQPFLFWETKKETNIC